MLFGFIKDVNKNKKSSSQKKKKIVFLTDVQKKTWLLLQDAYILI